MLFKIWKKNSNDKIYLTENERTSSHNLQQKYTFKSVVIWIVIEWEPLMQSITVLISSLKSPNEFDRKFYKQGGIFL